MSDYDILVKGEVVKGKFCPDNIAVYQRWLTLHEGKRVEFGLSKEVKHRTNRQLEYYWGHVIWNCNIARGCENDKRSKDEVHAFFLLEVGLPLKTEIESRYQREDALPGVPSTRDFTTSQMSEYIERCKFLAHRKWPNVEFPDLELVRVKGPRR